MKELGDHSWFPSFFRNLQTDFIGFVAIKLKAYNAFIKYVTDLSLPKQKMIDLCSGSGEPAVSIFKKTGCFTSLLLTDKFPSPRSFSDQRIHYEHARKDVLDMVFENGACYTMFNAFHHFSDTEKLELIKKIRSSGSRAFIVEILEPNVICILKVLALTTFGSLVMTPFVRPFSLRRLFFTYIIPVNILTISFDGIVSVFKSRSLQQYQKLTVNTKEDVELLRLKNLINSNIILHIQPDESADNIMEIQQTAYSSR
jgi:hypothetical protein